MRTDKGPTIPRPTGIRPPYYRSWRENGAWWIIPIILAALSLLTAGYLSTFTPVKVIDGNHAISLSTHQTTVGDALREASISIASEDIVSPPLTAPLNRNDSIMIKRSKLVSIRVDSQDERTMRTQSSSVMDVLGALGYKIGARDKLLVNGQSISSLPDVDSSPSDTNRESPSVEIVLRHAQQVTIQEPNTVPITTQTTAPTVGEALMEAGYKIYLADQVHPSPGEPVQAGEVITINRSKPVSVLADGGRIKTRTLAGTVADVLAEVKIILYGNDYAKPSPETPITDNMEIRVVRVRQDIVINQEVIPFDTRVEPSADLELDHEGVGQEGVPGVHEQRTLVTYEDNAETKRELIADFIARDPKPKIYNYGTKVVVRTLDTPNGQVQYWRVIHMLATSYSASTAGVSLGVSYYGHVRCGFAMRFGIVAVDPRIVPLHTNVYVDGYGTGNACDTGSAIIGKRIDLGYDDNNLRLWYKWVDVYLLTPVPDNIRYNLD